MYLSSENNSTPAADPRLPGEEYVGGEASYFETYFAGIMMFLFCLIILCLQILKHMLKKSADEDSSSNPSPDEAEANFTEIK